MQKTTNNVILSPYPPGAFLKYATGPVIIPLTNDYLFRALLQCNNLVLKYLISALLHIPLSDILSVEILNPILLGQTYDEKDFYLDIRVCLNNKTIINLEMQVINEHNWPERSLSYLCRSFDNLCKGKDYINVSPAIQIGLLDFTLFPEYPEFYATYKMLNIKNHHIYSDKFQLSVLDLTHIDLATEEDKQFGLHHWANFFKTTTWEEIIMLAEQNEYILSAADTIYQLAYNDPIRLQCEAREDYYRRQRDMQIHMERVQKATADAQRAAEDAQKVAADAQKAAEDAQKNAEEAQKKLLEAEKRASSAEAENAKLRARIAQLEANI